jgi:hypothetical protein
LTHALPWILLDLSGSTAFEQARLEDYLERPEGYCDDDIEVPVTRTAPLSMCTNTVRYKLTKPCKIILIG